MKGAWRGDAGRGPRKAPDYSISSPCSLVICLTRFTWVPYQCLFPVGLFYLILLGIFCDIQNLVQALSWSHPMIRPSGSSDKKRCVSWGNPLNRPYTRSSYDPP